MAFSRPENGMSTGMLSESLCIIGLASVQRDDIVFARVRRPDFYGVIVVRAQSLASRNNNQKK